MSDPLVDLGVRIDRLKVRLAATTVELQRLRAERA